MTSHCLAKLRSAAAQTLAEQEILGAAVAIRIGMRAAFELGIGHRDLDGQAMPPDARCFIYSVTKPLIAALAQKRLELDTAFSLQPLAFDPAITLRQLLSHSSGLPNYGDQPAYQHAVRTQPGLPWSSADFLELAQTQEHLPPDTDWRYSNLGYLLVKLCLEQQTVRSLGELLHQEWIQPLGLHHSFVPVDLSQTGSLTPAWFCSTDWREFWPR